MAKEEVTLRDGDTWCLLLLNPEDPEGAARVVAGNFGQPGDEVVKPADMTWEEAAELATKDHSYLSPSDLDIRKDGKTGWTQEEPEVLQLSEVFDSGDHVGPTIEDIPAILIDEDLARQVAEATAADPPQKPVPDAGNSRRATDQVA